MPHIPKIITKIDTPIKLAALALVIIGGGAYSTGNENLAYFSIFAIVAIVLFAIHESGGTSPKESNTKNPADMPNDLRVEESIWKKLDPALADLGFTNRARSDSAPLAECTLEFSSAHGSNSLLLFQIKPGELAPNGIRLLQAYANEINRRRGNSQYQNIAVVCDVSRIWDGLFHFVRRYGDIVLLTNYSLKTLDDKNSGLKHLEKLLQ
jgi:hypothetical protein